MSETDVAEAAQTQLRALLDRDSMVPATLYDEHWVTWGELTRIADDIESLLVRHEVPRRGRVALVLRNRPSGLAALLGLLSQGRVPALVSPIQPTRSIVAAIGRLSPVAVVVDEEDDDRSLAETALQAGALTLHLSRDVIVGAVPTPATLRPDRLVADEIAMVVPTSGTTGPPKPIPISWSQLPFDVSLGVRLPAPPESKPPVIHALSMATITGVMGVLRAAANGRSMALLERVDVARWSQLVERFRLRQAGLPPAAMRTMLDEGVPPERLTSLEAWHTGSAPLPPELQREFESTFGVPVLVAYGATEFGGSVAGWTLDMHRNWIDRKLGSVGRAVDGVELRIVDEVTGETLPPDHVGLLCVRRFGFPSADGDGWMRTNDRARIDPDGFLYIDGRADDVIVRGGFKVPLDELESLVREHPQVRACAALGLPDERLGHVPGLAVVFADGAQTDAEGLRSWIRERTAPYKVPTKIIAFDALPMGASHKVDRAELRAAFGATDSADTSPRS